MYFVPLVALLAYVITTKGSVIPIEKDDQNVLCLSKVMEKYPETYTLLIKNDEANIKVNNSYLYFEEENFTASSLLGKYNMYIFILKNTQMFNQTLSNIYETHYWNSRAKYLILLTSPDQKEMDLIFQIAWKYLIFNLSVIFGEEVYTFYPYTKTNCAQYTNYEKICSCLKLEEVFPEKIPLDMNGCGVKLMPYIIAPFVISLDAPRDNPALAGVELTIAHNIAKRMNFTEVYKRNPYPHWGYKYPDGSYSMMFLDLHKKEIDIIFGFIYGNYSYIFDFDISFCHLKDKSVWFFPTALQMAQWKNLTAIFEGRLWLAIFLMIIINGFSWWVVGRTREKEDEFNDLTLCLMASLYVLLQGSVKPPQKGNLRIIFFIWLVSCLMIFTAHQCQLISILTNPIYDKQMETLEELIATGSEYGFYPTVAEAYFYGASSIQKEVLANYKPCNLTAECLNRTAFQRDFAVVKNVRQVSYLTPRIYSFPNGRPMLYMTEEVAFVTLMRYHFIKGFPLQDRFDNILMRLESNGLVDKWDVDSRFKVLRVESEPDHEALSLGHLQGAFFVYLIGVIVSVTVLGLEKIAGFAGCCKKKKKAYV